MAHTSFNQTIIPSIAQYLSEILERVSARDQKGRTLKLNTYRVLESDSSYVGELIHTSRSEVFHVEFIVDVIEPTGEVNQLETSLEVPRMVNNLFIIDGKSRVATNTLSNDYICRIYSDNIYLDPYKVIRWHFPDGITPTFDPEFFWLEIVDLDGNKQQSPLTEKVLDTYKELLKLSDEQIWKLKVKLDTDEVGEYVTMDLIEKLFLLGEDKWLDSIIDKRITTIESDFIHHIRMPDNRRKIISAVQNNFFQYGGIYLTSLASIMKTYFRTAKSKCIEIPSNVNPLVYDSLKYKLVLPEYLAYNETFADLIDPANTPENNNVNIINEMNVCSSVEAGRIYISCYDYKTGKKVKLPYFEYLTKVVLSNECYDYDEMKPKELPTYKYKCRLKTHEVAKLSDIEIDLVEPAPDEKLSYTSRRIPMVNMSDSVRVAMGCSMIKQSIEVKGTEPRLIDTGNDDVDYATSSSVTTYNGISEGEVVEITSENVMIKDSATGIIVPVSIPSPIVGANKSLITYKPLVKVGEKVIPNQFLIAPSTMTKGSYDLGVNARVVYMNYLGYSYEDGVIVSQSYADRMTHYSMIDVTIPVKSGDTLMYIRPVGSKVVSKDIIVNKTVPLKVNRKLGEALVPKGKSVLDAIKLSSNQQLLLVPNNTDEGYIVDLRIDRNPDFDDSRYDSNTHYTDRIVEEYLAAKSSDDYQVLPDNLKHLDLKPAGRDAFNKNIKYIISARIIRVNRMIVGSKSTNSYGSKGIVSLILPDECMPRLDLDGKGNGPAFEVIMNPAAVIARKNVSQLYEAALTKCIQAIHAKVGEMLEAGKSDECIEFLRTYYGKKFDSYTPEMLRDAYNRGILSFKMSVGSYSKIDYDTITTWMKDLNVREDDYVYCPDVVISQGENGIQAYSPEKARELAIKGKYYELGFVENPVITGMTYMYKLYHAAEYSGKVTSSRTGATDPVMGRGLRRSEGQKIGEMELWSLRSHDALDFLKEAGADIGTDEKMFLNELLLAGFMITDVMGLPYGSSYRENFKRLQHKYEE